MKFTDRLDRRTFIAAAIATGGSSLLAMSGATRAGAAATIRAATSVKKAGSDPPSH